MHDRWHWYKRRPSLEDECVAMTEADAYLHPICARFRYMLYLLNSPILTNYGDWRFEGPLELPEARTIAATDFTSAIGHAGAAQLLSSLLDIEIPVNRVIVAMQPGDQALVLRVRERLPEGAVLDAAALAGVAYDLSLLTRYR